MEALDLDLFIDNFSQCSCELPSNIISVSELFHLRLSHSLVETFPGQGILVTPYRIV